MKIILNCITKNGQKCLICNPPKRTPFSLPVLSISNPELLEEGMGNVRKALESGSEDKLATEVIQDIQDELTVEQAKKIELGSAVPLSEKTLGEASEEMINITADNGKYAGNINLDRIKAPQNIDDELMKFSQVFSSEIDEARRGTITNRETSNLSNLLGMTAEDLLQRKKGTAFNNAEQALAARRILVSSADNLSALAKKVSTLEASDIDKFEFRKALNLHYAIQSQVSGATAETGRALQSFNITAKSSQVKISQIKDLLESLPGGASTEKMAEAIASFDSPEQIGAFARNVQKATTVDMFLEAWINGLLSGPQTHVVNMTSNSLFMAWQVPERLLASGISKLAGDDAISSKEAVAQTYGLMEGFFDGIKAAGHVIKTGISADTLSKTESLKYKSISAANIKELPIIKKLDPNALTEGGTAARAVDFLAEAIRSPGRALLAEDEFFKSVGYRMELRARAMRAVQQEGLSGQGAATRITQILTDAETHAPDIHLAAIDAARYMTFTQPIENDILNSISKSRNPIVKVIAPFVRTPTNILKAGIERSLIAPIIMKSVRADIKAGGARRDLALARMSLGSMMMGLVTKASIEGKITGGGPSNKEEFKTWRRMHQPYSVAIKGKEYSFNRLEPIGMVFGLAADFAAISGLAGEELQPEIDELAGAITASIAKNVTSKTWLTGLSNAIQALDDPDRYGSRYVQGFVKSLVPSIVAQAERTIDPEMEAIYSNMDAIKSRIPGLSASLPRMRNLWGEPISIAIDKNRSWSEAIFTTLSPVYIAETGNDPIDKELLVNNIHIRNQDRVQVFKGISIELTPQQYDDFIVIMNKQPLQSTGANLKSSLNDMVKNNEQYKRAGKDLKETIIRAKLLEAKELAKMKWLEKNPEYEQVIANEYRNMALAQ